MFPFYTGRIDTRAIDNLVSHGRRLLPRGWVLVLRSLVADRKHGSCFSSRFVQTFESLGKNIPTSKSEEIPLFMVELDGQGFYVLIKEAKQIKTICTTL